MTKEAQQLTDVPVDLITAEIEAHTIDVIPEGERQGKVRSQFTLWFATNANVFNFVLGGFAILWCRGPGSACRR
jgi:hypothetical protein